MIAGGFNSRPYQPMFEATEEEIRGAVKKLLDDMAPGGGYAFFGGVTGEDPVSKRRNE